MKKEIEYWWMSYDLPVSDVIRIGLRNNSQLTKPAIQAAIEAVYKENNPDLTIPRWKLAWTVWKYARIIEASEKRAIYVRKYEGERKELVILRVKKIKYEQIRRANFDNTILLFSPYWIMIGLLGMIIYFLR